MGTAPPTRGPATTRTAGLASLGAGTIHAVVVEDHGATWWASGTFFALLAAFQLAWGLWVLVRPDSRTRRGRSLLLLGVAVNLASAALWAVTRWVTGEPFGPAAGAELPVGPAGVASTGLELVLVAVALISLRVPARPVRGLLAGTVAVAAVLAAPTVWGVQGALAHDHADHTGTDHTGTDHHDDGHDEDPMDPTASTGPSDPDGDEGLAPSEQADPDGHSEDGHSEDGHSEDGHSEDGHGH